MAPRRRSVACATVLVVVALLVPLTVEAHADPLPSLTVTPLTALVDLQSVTVTGSGFEPGASYAVEQCSAGAPTQFECLFGGLAFATADASGEFTVPVVVRRTIRTTSSLSFDCVAMPGACEITVASSFAPDAEVLARAALEFDPAVPVDLPTVTVDPATGLVDGQVIDVHAAGFAPDESTVAIICAIGGPLRCAPGQFAATDGSGAVHYSFTVRRVVTPNFGGGEPFDCASAPGACAVFVTSLLDPVLTSWRPVSFDPTVPLPAGISAAPLTDLVDGQIVSVRGTVVGSSSVVGIQCRTDQIGNDASRCSQATVQFANVDLAGRVTLDFRVRRVLSTPTGDVDCSAAPGACALLIGRLQPNGEIERFALAFRVDDGVSPGPVPRFTG